MFTQKMITGAAVAGMLLTAASTAFAIAPMDKMFTSKAAQGGIFEVKSSHIALTHTKNRMVLDVAHRMIKQHTFANNQLKTIAQNQNIALPQETDPKHQAIIAKLSGLHGAAFDKAYIGAQEEAHTATVKLFEKEIASGENKNITAFATENLPTFEAHTKMIFQVGTDIGVHKTMMPALPPARMPSDLGGKNM
jgi:putative membrane protein